MKTDLEIQKDVMEELKWESFIKSSEIGVAVTNGVVTLSGYVDNFTKKKAAENAALRVVGVKAVAEDISVKIGIGSHVDDTEIAHEILNAFKWHSSIPEDQLKIKVESGWVTIEGEVEWNYEKNAVKKTIENLNGVRGISDLVTISPKINPENIKEKITSSFHRNATLDANNIIVENEGTKLILKGSVRSYAEKQDAERAAWNIAGISAVENKLEVNVPVLTD